VAEEALVDDTDTGSAFTARLIDIFYPVISSRTVYLHAFLILTMVNLSGCPVG